MSERPEFLVDEIWTLTAPESHDRLGRRCGWTQEAYAVWLADAFAQPTVREGSRGSR